MAAKFSDAAATCFSHAQSLAPDDMRWAYYYGHACAQKRRSGARGGGF